MFAASLFLLLFVLLILGVPIYGAIGFSTLLHYFETGREAVLLVFTQQLFRGITGYALLAVPMFILAGNIMSKSGITDRLIDLAKALIGHFTGGIAQVNILASVFFASISGSAHADVAAIGSVLIPVMEKEGYKKGFAGALTAASGILSPLFPPSIVMVVYGATFGVSIGALFAAGMGVALLLALIQMVITYLLVRKLDLPRQPRRSMKEIGRATWRAILPLGMPIIILGGIMGGYFTATEASAVAVFYALVVSIVIYRNLTLKDLYEIFRKTAFTSAAIIILMGMARIFSYVIARRNIPDQIMDGMLGITDEPQVLLFIVLAVLVVAGMFIDRTTNVLLFTPIVAPILVNVLGFSPLHAGMSIIMALGIGHLTPPVGGTLITTALVGNLSVEEVTRYSWPYILSLFIITFIVLYIPQITETIPRMLGFTF